MTRKPSAAAAADGYQVVHGSQLSAAEWARVREANALPAAGQVKPTKRSKFSENGPKLPILNKSEYTPGMAAIVRFAEQAGQHVVGQPITARVARSRQAFAAWYGQHEITFNLNRLGWAWFANGITDDVIDLVIHELGHEYESNHLSAGYYRALTDVGARMVRLALTEPEIFARTED